jgi:5'-deoxynucleotidase YfbR-like HD superfamily hydrolase
MLRGAADSRPVGGTVDPDVRADIDLLMWSATLGDVRRFYKQPFWEDEGRRSDEAREVEGDVRLEDVAAHSWKVADAVVLLADRFPQLDRARCIELAVVHDKLELITGDYSPIDEDATGRTTHAFNSDQAALKVRAEENALEWYLSRMRPEQRDHQRRLYREVIRADTEEARFVYALDKLAALVYVLQRKPCGLVRAHYHFTVKYSAKAVESFPALDRHHRELVGRLRLLP